MKQFLKQTLSLVPRSFLHGLGFSSLFWPLPFLVGTLLLPLGIPPLPLLVRTSSLALVLPLAYQAYRLAVDARPGRMAYAGRSDAPSRTARALYQTVFLVQAGTHRVPVPVEAICYFFRDGRHTFLRTFDRQDYLLSQPLQEVEQSLDPACFFRVNRRLLIHYKACPRFKPAAYGKLELTLHPPLPFPVIVSQLKTPAFRRWMQR